MEIIEFKLIGEYLIYFRFIVIPETHFLSKFLKISILFFLIFAVTNCYSQAVTIIPSGISPASNNYLRLEFDQINALPNSQRGDIAYDLTFNCLRVFNGLSWVCTFQNPSDNPSNIAAIATASGSSSGQGTAVDFNGNVYIVGYYYNEVSFGSITKTSTTPNGDAFIAKYNSSGQILWVQTIDATNSSFASCITVDNNGNIYIGGNFGGTANFGSITKSSSYIDAFIAKYDSVGVIQWVQNFGSTYLNSVTCIASDGIGNVYISGYFTATINIAGILFTSSGDFDIFTVKLNAIGTLQWVKTAGGTNTDWVRSIAIDNIGNVVITGGFKGSINFGAVNKVSAGDYDIFLAKYSNNGIFQWVQSVGGTISDNAWSVATDNSGGILITGTFAGTVNFGTITKTALPTATFIAKCGSTGIFQWVQSIDKASAYAITLDNSNNIYVTGNYTGTISFGVNAKISSGLIDIFVVKCNESGLPIWIQSAGGKNIDGGNDIVIDTNNKIFVTGYCSLISKFGATVINATGTENMF